MHAYTHTHRYPPILTHYSFKLVIGHHCFCTFPGHQLFFFFSYIYMIHLYSCVHPNSITQSHDILCCSYIHFPASVIQWLFSEISYEKYCSEHSWKCIPEYLLTKFPLGLSLVLLSHLVVSNYFVTPRTVTCQESLTMGFPRQEYRRGQPFSSPGDLPDSGIQSTFPASEGGLFTTELPGKPFPSVHTGKENFWVARYVTFSPFRNGAT